MPQHFQARRLWTAVALGCLLFALALLISGAGRAQEHGPPHRIATLAH